MTRRVTRREVRRKDNEGGQQGWTGRTNREGKDRWAGEGAKDSGAINRHKEGMEEERAETR